MSNRKISRKLAQPCCGPSGIIFVNSFLPFSSERGGCEGLIYVAHFKRHQLRQPDPETERFGERPKFSNKYPLGIYLHILDTKFHFYTLIFTFFKSEGKFKKINDFDKKKKHEQYLFFQYNQKKIFFLEPFISQISITQISFKDKFAKNGSFRDFLCATKRRKLRL